METPGLRPLVGGMHFGVSPFIVGFTIWGRCPPQGSKPHATRLTYFRMSISLSVFTPYPKVLTCRPRVKLIVRRLGLGATCRCVPCSWEPRDQLVRVSGVTLSPAASFIHDFGRQVFFVGLVVTSRHCPCNRGKGRPYVTAVATAASRSRYHCNCYYRA